ncbi:MAG: hypothetical protein ACR2GN_02905 [Bacteroidia bacterium]
MSFRQALSIFFLCVFAIITVPKELIHELHHHEDTLHIECSRDFSGTRVEDHHIHCDYLNFEFKPFNSESFFPLNYFTVDFTELVTRTINDSFSPPESVNYLRGPPSFIA